MTPPSRQIHLAYVEVTSIESPLLEASPALGFIRKLAPIWTGLIRLGDRAFGAGAWQPYTARFWPVGLLLIVTFVAVRHHSNASMAWAAVLVTGMLPMVSVSVRSANDERFRWAGDEAELVLSPAGQAALTIEIEPGPDLAGGPLALSVVAQDGSSLRLPPITTRRAMTLSVPGAPGGKRVLRLRNEGPTPQRGIGGRVLNFRVFDAYWGRTPLPHTPALLLKLNDPADVTPADKRRWLADTGTAPEDGLFVGFGWYPAERAAEPFRWATSDAEIVVTRPTGRRRELQLDLEPGPGMGAHPFELDVVGADEAVVATVRAQGRAAVRVPLPLRSGTESRVFRLRVRGGGIGVPSDPRILNFRVFSVLWAPG